MRVDVSFYFRHFHLLFPFLPSSRHLDHIGKYSTHSHQLNEYIAYTRFALLPLPILFGERAACGSQFGIIVILSVLSGCTALIPFGFVSLGACLLLLVFGFYENYRHITHIIAFCMGV